jgi:hypothetical protein
MNLQAKKWFGAKKNEFAGKKEAEALRNWLLEKTNDQVLKGLEIKPWTKSLLPCHIDRDNKEYADYLEMMELI